MNIVLGEGMGGDSEDKDHSAVPRLLTNQDCRSLDVETLCDAYIEPSSLV